MLFFETQCRKQKTVYEKVKISVYVPNCRISLGVIFLARKVKHHGYALLALLGMYRCSL